MPDGLFLPSGRLCRGRPLSCAPAEPEKFFSRRAHSKCLAKHSGIWEFPGIAGIEMVPKRPKKPRNGVF